MSFKEELLSIMEKAKLQKLEKAKESVKKWLQDMKDSAAQGNSCVYLKYLNDYEAIVLCDRDGPYKLRFSEGNYKVDTFGQRSRGFTIDWN